MKELYQIIQKLINLPQKKKEKRKININNKWANK